MPTPLPRHIFSTDSGQSTLELVFSLPLFLILILGTAEIANVTWAAVQVNNAARAAAAYASQSRANASPLNITSITQAAKNEAPKLTQLRVSSYNDVCYCVDSGIPGSPDPGCANTNLTTCLSPSTIQVTVQVNVQAAVTPFVHYPGLPATYTVNAQASMGVEQ
jgi:Flp pilus assembly protein TadG